MNSIYNYTLEELGAYFESIGDKKYRATQVFEWLYRNRVSDFDQMTNLSKKGLSVLKEEFTIDRLKIVRLQKSSDGTRKYLFELSDGKMVESVLMRHNYGNSICISTQVGCNMGCAFCASGELGKVRNLELSEMVLQVLMVQIDLDQDNERISNIVVMGTGEPFDNYQNLLRFLSVVNYPKGLEIGARHITVSTCGIVPKILEFAFFPLQINLAISLHAPNDEIRNDIMKINRKYKINDVMEAVNTYLEKTNRRVTFEYILIGGVNDSLDNAEELAKLLKNTLCYVNLIPYNEVSTKPFKKTTHEQAEKFFSVLRKKGINATLRMEHGADIDAAGGHLRAKVLKEKRG